MTAITEKLKKAVFNNDIDRVEVLWRMTSGNRDKAYQIIRDTAKHYHMTDLTDLEIDIALGEMNDGIEMEWAS
jgi:hypothetical protein